MVLVLLYTTSFSCEEDDGLSLTRFAVRLLFRYLHWFAVGGPLFETYPRPVTWSGPGPSASVRRGAPQTSTVALHVMVKPGPIDPRNPKQVPLETTVPGEDMRKVVSLQPFFKEGIYRRDCGVPSTGL